MQASYKEDVYWLLTRTQADNLPLVAALRARGQEALSFPCIERHEHAWPDKSADVVMLTSRVAAEALVRAALSPMPLLAALSERTAPVLTRAGLSVAVTADGGAVALAKEVARAFAGRSVLYVHSAQAVHRAEHEAALVALRTHVVLTTHALYDVSLPAEAKERWPSLPPSERSVLFASPSAVENFFSLQAGAPQPAPERVACLGASTLSAYEVARPSDFPHAFLVPVGDADVIAEALS